jgi:hypothetical protein
LFDFWLGQGTIASKRRAPNLRAEAGPLIHICIDSQKVHCQHCITSEDSLKDHDEKLRSRQNGAAVAKYFSTRAVRGIHVRVV